MGSLALALTLLVYMVFILTSLFKHSNIINRPMSSCRQAGATGTPCSSIYFQVVSCFEQVLSRYIKVLLLLLLLDFSLNEPKTGMDWK